MNELQPSRCNGCGVCIDVCPFGVLSLDEQTGKINIVEDSKCTDCGACALQCSTQAISVDVQGCGCIWNVTRRKLNQRKDRSTEISLSNSCVKTKAR